MENPEKKIITRDPNQDISFDLIKGDSGCVWERCDTLILLYVATGEAQVICAFGKYTLAEEDIITVNAYEMYMLQVSSGGEVLRMQINPGLLRIQQDILFGRSVFCCSCEKNEEKQERYDSIRACLARAYEAVGENSVPGGYEAYTQVLSEGVSISEIALNNGFANTNAFISAFHENYGTSPGKYRKLQTKRILNDRKEEDESEIKKGLAKYLGNIRERKGEAQGPLVLKRRRTLQANTGGEGMKDSWRELLGGGRAKDLLMPMLQNQIQKCQKEIGFRFLEILEIFHRRIGQGMVRRSGS